MNEMKEFKTFKLEGVQILPEIKWKIFHRV